MRSSHGHRGPAIGEKRLSYRCPFPCFRKAFHVASFGLRAVMFRVHAHELADGEDGVDRDGLAVFQPGNGGRRNMVANGLGGLPDCATALHVSGQVEAEGEHAPIECAKRALRRRFARAGADTECAAQFEIEVWIDPLPRQRPRDRTEADPGRFRYPLSFPVRTRFERARKPLYGGDGHGPGYFRRLLRAGFFLLAFGAGRAASTTLKVRTSGCAAEIADSG